MNLSEQLINLHNSEQLNEGGSFKIENKGYPNGGVDDKATKEFAKKDMENLCKLLGIKFIETSFGYGKAELDGRKIDLTADRSKPVIVLQVENNYQDRVRIKDKLSAKQIKNLRAKIEKQIRGKEDAENRHQRLAKAREAVYKAGIEITSDYNDGIKVDGVDLRYVNGKIESSESIYLSNRYIGSVKVKDGEKGIDKILANFKKELMKEIKDIEKAVKKAEKHTDKLEKYFTIKNEK